MWSNTFPIEEGWYFWRARHNNNDPWKWMPVYLLEDTEDETTEQFSCWTDGVCIHTPKGGWWKRIKE